VIGVLTHRHVLALAHHVANIAEHEEIAGDGARQAADIVGSAGDKASRKAAGEMGGGILVRNRLGHAPGEIVRQLNISGSRNVGKALGEVGIPGRERLLDIAGEHRGIIPQCRAELRIGQSDGVILRGEHGAGVARMRQQQQAGGRADRYPRQSCVEPEPHGGKPYPCTSLEMVRHIVDTTAPTKEGLFGDTRIVSNLYE
jgi:hypothetical protein